MNPEPDRDAKRGVPTDHDEYLAGQPEPQRTALQALRDGIRRLDPAAVETISYGMPAFRHGGRILVYYAGFRSHCSLFPASVAAIEALGDELTDYRTSKGTLQFDPALGFPAALLERVIRFRVAELGEKPKRPEPKRSPGERSGA